MYHKMLVPLDGSKLAEIVLDYAQQIARRLGLNLMLLHVCSRKDSDYISLHRAYIEKSAERLQDQVQVRGEVVIGEPAGEILRYSHEHEADIILMSTHGRSGQVNLWPMGNVVHRVISASPVPVWLVPSRMPPEIIYDEWPTRKILVPLDGSRIAEATLPYVADLIGQHGHRVVEVILMTVCVTPFTGSDTLDSLMPPGWRARIEPETVACQDEAKAYLASLESELKQKGLTVRSEVLTGEPASEIIRYTDQNAINLVAMTTHGHSANLRWPYGSVAHKVINGITSPVFMVEPENTAAP